MNRLGALLDGGGVLKARVYGRAWTLDILRVALSPVLVTILVGCTGADGLPTDPSGRPLLDQSGAPALAGSLSPTANNQVVGPITLGSYTYPTLAVIQVSGLLDRYYGPTSYWGQSAGTFVDQWDAGGLYTDFDGCTGDVRVLSASGGAIFCDVTHENLKSVWADTQVVQGTVAAQWQPGPIGWGITGCGPGGQPPCWTYTGSHSVTVTPVSASLRLVASRYVTSPSAPSVTFTASVSPAQVGQHPVPLSVQSWTWVPDGGSGSGPTCGSANPCIFTPSSSGTMSVNAVVNGATQTMSAHIRVLCEPTGNPLLDNLPILDALNDAWSQSGAGNPDKDQRRERPWSVQCDTGMVCDWTVHNPIGATPCQTPPAPPDPTGGRITDGHVHPFVPYGVPNAESLPSATCPPKTIDGTTFYGGTRYALGGPSPADYQNAAGPGAGIPHFLMDANTIYFLPAGTNPGSIAAGTVSIPRIDSHGCRRV